MKEKVLVINEDDQIRASTAVLLRERGFETFEADHGRQGIEESIKVTPDLILLDASQEGYATCTDLKSNPRTEHIPVIFLASSPKEKIKGLELGGVDFINDNSELLVRVQNQLKIQSLTQALRSCSESLDKDLSAASIIQRSLLPSPQFKSAKVEIAWGWIPQDTLGGDSFNIFPINDSMLAFYMLDVCGHDVPSALVTVSVSQFLQQHKHLAPHELMVELDREYPLEKFDRYFSMFYGVLNTMNGELSFTRAGHTPAIKLSQDGSFKLLNEGGPVVGLNLGIPFEEGNEVLVEGDKIILYTDGITDLRNKRDEFFGTKNFYSLLKDAKGKPIKTVIGDVLHKLKEFGKSAYLQDDISIMGFEYT